MCNQIRKNSLVYQNDYQSHIFIILISFEIVFFLCDEFIYLFLISISKYIMET